MAAKAGDFSTVAQQKFGLLWRQRIQGLADVPGRLHQLCFLVGTGGVVRVAQHNHRAGLDVAGIGIECLKLAHYGRIAHGKKRGLQRFAGHAFGHDIEARLLGLRAVE